MFEIKVQPEGEQEEADVEMDWEVIEFTQNRLLIQANFVRPLAISFDETNEIEVIFADPNLWISFLGVQMNPENRTIKRALMRQLPKEADNTQDAIMDAA